ncbi:RILP-like protein 1 isoform X1 [Pygocentrus nattereri]|uniref:RILP-like protein 1 n=1 Tax=Pygocentrus nattereri TaxID=42514 RepID=A0A3B4E8J9_PYGNA|nr:RILP-like protein 1 isoform X1 [Pygocentrus nattereri]
MDTFGGVLEKSAAELTVLDVYDIAAVLGQEFERIVDQHGCASLTRLMPKVVRVLEILEGLVGRNCESAENDDLEMELRRLRLERRDRMEKEKMREKELEQVEDTWRRENQDLLSQIADLQVQNKSLRLRLSLKEQQNTEEKLQHNEGTRESEHQLTKKLKERVDQQQDEIKAKDREITLKNNDIETLHVEQHRLMKINQDLKHWISILEAQGKALIQQRANLEALSQARQQDLGSVKMQLAYLNEEHQADVLNVATELVDCSSPRQLSKTSHMQPPRSTPGDIEKTVWAECETEWDSLAEHFDPPKSLALVRTHTEKGSKEDHHICATEGGSEVTPSLWEALCEDDQEEDNSALDHNIPQFTLQDLQDVLQEKNELKAQVFLLQEELAYYKSEEELEDQLSPLVPVLLPALQPSSNNQPESGIKKLLFTAVMPMVAAGLINDDPTLQPISRLISVV